MTNYTNATSIRLEAGLTNNTDILDATITEYINEAHGIILGKLATYYDITKLDDSDPLFVGSVAKTILIRVEKLLSSGYLLIKEYGTLLNQDKDDEAKRRIDEAFSILDLIVSGEIQLIDSAGDVIPFKDTSTSTTTSLRAYGMVYTA